MNAWSRLWTCLHYRLFCYISAGIIILAELRTVNAGICWQKGFSFQLMYSTQLNDKTQPTIVFFCWCSCIHIWRLQGVALLAEGMICSGFLPTWLCQQNCIVPLFRGWLSTALHLVESCSLGWSEHKVSGKWCWISVNQSCVKRGSELMQRICLRIFRTEGLQTSIVFERKVKRCYI